VPCIFYAQHEMLVCAIRQNRAMYWSTDINIIEMTVPNTDVPEIRNILTEGYWSTFSITTVYQIFMNYT
jgi:hypothetical protein